MAGGVGVGGRRRNTPPGSPGEVLRYARDEHYHLFRARAKAGLFIMVKLYPRTPDTDAEAVTSARPSAGPPASRPRPTAETAGSAPPP